MVRGLSCVILLGILSHAPYQCARSHDLEARREETPGEALYELAGRLRSDGDEQAYRATLAFLVERYPSSRWAEAARLDLASAGDGGFSTQLGRP